jgi:hypothetical protein
MLLTANPTAARVLAELRQIGLIHWSTEDESRRLVVFADAGSQEMVRDVAEDIASKLGWRFVEIKFSLALASARRL